MLQATRNIAIVAMFKSDLGHLFLASKNIKEAALNFKWNNVRISSGPFPQII